MPGLVDYSLVFLDRSWEWLNDPEIKAMTLTPDFSKDDQLAFFKSLPSRKDYWIKGIMEDGIPIGAMGLKHITPQQAEYWGYIGDKNYWGRGIGNFMMEETIKKATDLALQQIYLHVDKQNTRARQLYEKKGFVLTEEGDTEKYLLKL